MSNQNTGRDLRIIRHRRLRKKLTGTSIRPRLCVSRSLKNIFAQIVDDEIHHTLVAASSLDKELISVNKDFDKTQRSKLVGEKIAKVARSKGISQVVFDRGGYVYHGRVKALAEAARKGGLIF